MSTGIVTDSGCDFPVERELNHDVGIVPLLFRFGSEEFPDKSIPMDDFLQKVEKTWPTTSAPSPGDYIQAIRESLTRHDQVLVVTISGKHSAAYTSAVLAGQQFPPEQVMVLDSESLSIGQGMIVAEAAQAALQGKNLQQVLAAVQALKQRLHLFIALDTVKFLVKGGRASQLTGILAGVLQIRPILTLVDGRLTLMERPRGRKASIQRMLDIACGYLPANQIVIGHVACPAEAEELAAQAGERSKIHWEDIPVIETGMAIATHGGPGTIGILVDSG